MLRSVPSVTITMAKSTTLLTPGAVRHMAMSATVNNNSPVGSVVIKGLTFEDYDRTVNVSVWSLAKLFEGTRKISFDDLHVLPELNKQSLAYIVSSRYRFSHDVYIPYEQALDFPLKFNTYLSNIGKSSFAVHTKCYKLANHVSSPLIMMEPPKQPPWHQNMIKNDGIEQCIAECDVNFVAVDNETHKPSPLPKWFHDKFQNYCVIPNGEQFRFIQLEEPDETRCFKYKIVVRPSDIDHNWHTHHTTFLRYCIDGASVAAVKGKLKNFTQDLCFYRSKEVQCIYKGESDVGDDLELMLWESSEKENQLCFIVKKDNVTISIFQAKIDFYLPAVPQRKRYFTPQL